ncbi:hypothetical protein Bca4012_010316 [Brassica carinata]|uniref:Uncharacterized protein n=1 Tax=Brassica carinata TaxID=52824 RepID=A0A8X7V3X8_BRACI|nr:hypothetical protein Bca52824_035278 [Brassica carinata]
MDVSAAVSTTAGLIPGSIPVVSRRGRQISMAEQKLRKQRPRIESTAVEDSRAQERARKPTMELNDVTGSLDSDGSRP